MKRQVYGQIRGVLRPFGVRLPARAGTKRFDEAARAAVRGDDTLYACVAALLEALGAVEARGSRRWTSASGRSSDARRRAGG
jgi:transposase